ncbi:hypothetical protein GF377_05105 [candidate division GN15 bacterium]|nr:hypothetical protein [candidate division GN15 bacterium]
MEHAMVRHLKNQRGFATLIALIMMGMLLLIGVAAISTTDDEITVAGNELQEMRAFYAAEAGLEAAAAAMQDEYDSTGLPPVIMPTGTDSLNLCEVTYSAADRGPATKRVLSVGSLAGLHALVKSFDLTSTATSSFEKSRVVVSQSFETALVPIFQFAVFYHQDLELDPGPDMTLIGRVHSNGNMFLNPASALQMDSYVTAHGEIVVGAKGSDPMKGGNIYVKDAFGNYEAMKQGGDVMDHNHSDWYDSSVSWWDGRVQDEAHGTQSLNVPISNSGDPHLLIERAAGNPDSYENKASLKIVGGQVYRFMEDNTWQNVTAAMISDGVVSYAADKFWDDRDDQWVDVTELDIEAMYDQGYAPRNGVLYFSDDIAGSGEWPALRLHNASELDDGLTIACENPLYTVGDFNSVNKKPASFLSDAYTVLSRDFNDDWSQKDRLWRKAVTTTVNVSYVTGGVETRTGVESGGFHNLPRFLEVWSGREFRWSGSAIHLWYSQQATASWQSESGGYYSAPTRVWAYDTDLDDPNNLPPETPVVRVFQRTGWKQEHVSLQ